MAVRMPKLSEKAIVRIVETSQAQGISPDALVLKFIPVAPKPTSTSEALPKPKKPVKPKESLSSFKKRVETRAKALAKNPKALAQAEKRFFGDKPPVILEDEEANRLTDEAVLKYRLSKKAKQR